jgi:hypothetical protein
VSEYWVYTWLDSHRIRTIDQFKTSLASRDILPELKEAAKLVIDTWRNSPLESRPRSLIAGAGIDLSGRLDCNATSCRRSQVDRLFRRAWHYFDTIVARDSIAEDLVVHRDCPDSELFERLPALFETVLIVRDLGAEELVEFLPRVPACFEHWRQHAREAGIDDIAEREDGIVDEFTRDIRAEIVREHHRVVCTLNSPDFSHTQWVAIDSKETKGKSEKQIIRAAVAKVMREFLVNLTADVKAAKMYGGAFGSTIPAFQRILAHRRDEAASVAVELELPTLEGLSTAELIGVRCKYEDTFARFQKRIRNFVAECVRDGTTSPEDVRSKLNSDLIDRDLEELRGNLRDAQKSLRMKSTYALGLGTLVATIGVTTGIVAAPVAFGLAATISGSSLSPGVSKYIDEITSVKSHDLYFLLQAEGHSH